MVDAKIRCKVYTNVKELESGLVSVLKICLTENQIQKYVKDASWVEYRQNSLELSPQSPKYL